MRPKRVVRNPHPALMFTLGVFVVAWMMGDWLEGVTIVASIVFKLIRLSM